MEKECIFCKIASGEAKSEKVKESSNFFAIRDIYPVRAGHTLVIPKQHYDSLLDLPDELGNELVQFLKEVAQDLIKEGYGDGFNVLINNFESAGQVIKHAHIHVIPRKKQDGLRLIA